MSMCPCVLGHARIRRRARGTVVPSRSREQVLRARAGLKRVLAPAFQGRGTGVGALVEPPHMSRHCIGSPQRLAVRGPLRRVMSPSETNTRRRGAILWLTYVSQGTALLILFVVVPVVAAVAVIAFVQWRSPTVPAGYLTSELLRDGTPATATLLDWQTPGQSFLDQRPMVTFRVAVHDDEPAELTITQSVPRGVLHRMKPGMRLDVRLSKDGLAGAVAFEQEER